MKTLLEIKNLNITFGFNDQIVNAVSNSSFKINKGECFAIIFFRINKLPNHVPTRFSFLKTFSFNKLPNHVPTRFLVLKTFNFN